MCIKEPFTCSKTAGQHVLKAIFHFTWCVKNAALIAQDTEKTANAVTFLKGKRGTFEEVFHRLQLENDMRRGHFILSYLHMKRKEHIDSVTHSFCFCFGAQILKKRQLLKREGPLSAPDSRQYSELLADRQISHSHLRYSD